MKICLEAYHLSLRGGGILNYIYYLVKTMAVLAPEDEFTLFCNYFDKNAFCPEFNISNINYHKFYFPRRTLTYLWKNFNLPKIENLAGKVDVVHGTHILLPPAKKAKKVLTIHDVIYLKYPEYYSNRGLYEHSFKVLLPYFIKKADVIITISQSTKNDLMQIFKIDEEKIKVIHYGVNFSLNKTVSLDISKKILEKLNIKTPYIFYSIGTIEKRKNLQTTLEAFKIFLEEIKEEYYLVLAGFGEFPEDIFKKIQELNLTQRVILKNYLNTQEVVSLLINSDMVIYPSLYEGFGLPVLEAFVCEKPLITSNISSLPEVAGEAASLVNPKNKEEIAKAMYNIKVDKNLRQELISKGKELIKNFSWESCAQKTLSVYKSLK